MVSTTTNALAKTEAWIYAELQRQLHDALRAQHPEWIQPNGESLICDSYDARFTQVLNELRGADSGIFRSQSADEMKRSHWQRKVKAPIEPQPLAHIKAVLARLKQGEVNNRVVLKVAQ